MPISGRIVPTGAGAVRWSSTPRRCPGGTLLLVCLVSLAVGSLAAAVPARRAAERVPAGLTLDEQAEVLPAELDSFAERHAVGRGFLLLAHSYGGKLALMTVGHNISLGRAARCYHLRALAVFEECLQSAPETTTRPTRTTGEAR
ncbi:hypothetical protein EDD95_0918 [Streptomyces sp. CEV 2-1]|nr:hypothetical protein EDD95_0918 [Streptomyces sp. CEV 2-1]